MIFAFEDSELAAVSLQGDALQLRFSAARVYDGDRAGAGEGRWQPLLLICKQLTQSEKALKADLMQILCAMGRIQHAQLQIAGQRLRSLPLSFDSDAVFALELEFSGGLFCRLHGQGLELRAMPGLCVVDSYQC